MLLETVEKVLRNLLKGSRNSFCPLSAKLSYQFCEHFPESCAIPLILLPIVVH